MSALIKQGAATVTRAFSGEAQPKPAASAAARPDPRDSELARLRDEIGRLEGELAEAGKAAIQAREQGHRAGLAAAADDAEERRALLRETLTDAYASFEDRLAILDGLAPALVRTALGKLFAPSENWAAMAEAMVARQLRDLRRSAVVVVRVSPLDFGPDSIAPLGAGQVPVEADPDLESGQARIECRLEQIDLDVRAQWASLSALLDVMAKDDPA